MKIKITDLARGVELPEDQKRTLRPKPKITPKKKNVPKAKKVVAKVAKPVTNKAKVVAKVKKMAKSVAQHVVGVDKALKNGKMSRSKILLQNRTKVVAKESKRGRRNKT